MNSIVDEIKALKSRLNVTVAAHFYQRDEVYNIADLTGDSLELAKKAKEDKNPILIFCGVGFMGQSVKILSPEKKVYMPKIACCSMAKMISSEYFNDSIWGLKQAGIAIENIIPITYINSSAEVKAKVGELGGMVCTSANAEKIIDNALKCGKKILFVPDKCLGLNIANKMGKKSCVLGDGTDPAECDIICYDGFCSVHQLFSVDDIDFYRKKFPDILIVVHPECDPSVVALADFVGSTSQIIKYVASLPADQMVAVGTEFNLVNRLRAENTFVLSSTKPECPTMNETTINDVYNLLLSIDRGEPYNEITLDEDVRQMAFLALNRMFEI
jgi:quinolinate synthase